MPVGAGLCPAGTVPAGYGVIDTAPAPILIPLPDYRTGLSDGGRFISQTTGDYVFTADGRLQGMPNVYQLVLLAIANCDFSSVTEKGPNYKAGVTSSILTALAYLTTQKLIQVKRITVIDRLPNMNPDATIALVDWIDMTSGQSGPQIPVSP